MSSTNDLQDHQTIFKGLQDDFDATSLTLTAYNSGTYEVTGGQLVVNSSDGVTRGVAIAYELEVGSLYTVEFDLELTDADYVYFQSGANSTDLGSTQRRFYNEGHCQLSFCAHSSEIVLAAVKDSAAAQIKLNYVRVTRGGNPLHSTYYSICVGAECIDATPENSVDTAGMGVGNVNLAPYGGIFNTTRQIGNVNIGMEAKIGENGGVGARIVNIGAEASREVDTTYDATATTGDSVGIGYQVSVYSWRGVAVGPLAVAAATSSTAIGANSVCTLVHGGAFGRGSWCPATTDKNTGVDQPNLVLGGSLINNSTAVGDVYFFNGWGNQFDTLPINGISIASRTDPSTAKIRLHGYDAWDSRSSSTQTNQGGGQLNLVGGLSTGSGTGGSVTIETSPATTSSNNKNSAVVAVEIDASSSADTRLLLLDVEEGTMKRVELGADDSGGTGYKVLRVLN